MPRYLHSSAFEAVRTIASEAMRTRRPRRAARARGYIPEPLPAPVTPVTLDVMNAVLAGLRGLEVRAA